MKGLERGQNLNKEINKSHKRSRFVSKALLAVAATSLVFSGCSSIAQETKPITPILTSPQLTEPGLQEIFNTNAESVINALLTSEAAKKYSIDAMGGATWTFNSEGAYARYGGPNNDSINLNYSSGKLDLISSGEKYNYISMFINPDGNLFSPNLNGNSYENKNMFKSDEQVEAKLKELYKIPEDVKLQTGSSENFSSDMVDHTFFKEQITYGSWTDGDKFHEIFGSKNGLFYSGWLRK